MEIRSEKLRLSSFTIEVATHTLKGGKTIMKRGSSSREGEWTIGDDLGLVPAGLTIPVDGEHMVREGLAEGNICVRLRLYLFIVILVHL